jgi:hypothetical protein
MISLMMSLGLPPNITALTCTNLFSINNSACLAHCVFISFLRFWKWKAIISLNFIHWRLLSQGQTSCFLWSNNWKLISYLNTMHVSKHYNHVLWAWGMDLNKNQMDLKRSTLENKVTDNIAWKWRRNLRKHSLVEKLSSGHSGNNISHIYT